MTKIEWVRNADGELGKTWNPLAGCSILSPGCTHCYAMRMAHRLAAMGVPHYQGLTKVVNGNPVWTGKLALAPDSILLEPLKRKKPTMYFVNSMSDLFHEYVLDEWIDRVFAVMALCPQHTFQVLTKRSRRMRQYMQTPDRKRIIAGEPVLALSDLMAEAAGSWKARPSLDHFSACFAGHGPFRNVWLGVSTERQKEADERIPDLLATPAAVRFVSAEPLLGALNLHEYLLGFSAGHPAQCGCGHGHGFTRCPNYGKVAQTCHRCECRQFRKAPGEAGLHWIIVGGESGAGARPMHFAWARSIVEQCKAAGVSVFVKQMGKTARSDRHDSVQAVALGAGWRADGPGTPEGIVSFRNIKGGDQIEWPADLRVREMPTTHTTQGAPA